MEYKFVEKNINEIEKLFFSTAEKLKIEITSVSLPQLMSLSQYGLNGDKEHDYSKFLKAYSIDKNQFVLLFGDDYVTDWKWLGYDNRNLADKFLVNLYEKREINIE